jgi:hypothetical protein
LHFAAIVSTAAVRTKSASSYTHRKKRRWRPHARLVSIGAHLVVRRIPASAIATARRHGFQSSSIFAELNRIEPGSAMLCRDWVYPVMDDPGHPGRMPSYHLCRRRITAQ